MKPLFLIIFAFQIFSCQAQKQELLIEKTLISDLSNTPIYSNLTETINDKIVWKETYKYIDSIEIYKITYMSDGLKIKGLLVKPKQQGNYPCVIFNRGGNRDFGALKMAHGIIPMGQIAKEGYVVIASQYRGNGGSEGQEEFGGADVNDVTILPEVLEEIEEADTDKIGMYGWSRGGMMTYIALTKTNRIKTAIVGGAISDSFKTIADRPEMETQVIAELVPNYNIKKEEALTERSAVKWANKFPKNVPILMLHGNADWRVKSEHSLKMALAFEKYRVPYRLVIFEGGDHGISEHKTEVNKQIINWFNKYLKQNAPLPNMEYHGR